MCCSEAALYNLYPNQKTCVNISCLVSLMGVELEWGYFCINTFLTSAYSLDESHHLLPVFILNVFRGLLLQVSVQYKLNHNAAHLCLYSYCSVGSVNIKLTTAALFCFRISEVQWFVFFFFCFPKCKCFGEISTKSSVYVIQKYWVEKRMQVLSFSALDRSCIYQVPCLLTR